MNDKRQLGLIIGLLVAVGVIIAIIYRIGGFDGLIDTRPVAPALNAFDGTVNLYGTKTAVSAAFCMANSTFTPKCDVNTAGKTGVALQEATDCKAAWDSLSTKFAGHCTTKAAPVSMSCQNKYLQVCGSGTGIPVTKSCTDSQYATIEGYLLVESTVVDLRNSLKVTIFEIDRTYSGKPLGIFDFLNENGRITFGLYTKSGTLLAKQDVDVDPTKIVGSQEVLWALDYKLQNADCDAEYLDDNLQVLKVAVYDEEGELVERAEYEIGQKDGSLSKKLLKYEGVNS